MASKAQKIKFLEEQNIPLGEKPTDELINSLYDRFHAIAEENETYKKINEELNEENKRIATINKTGDLIISHEKENYKVIITKPSIRMGEDVIVADFSVDEPNPEHIKAILNIKGQRVLKKITA